MTSGRARGAAPIFIVSDATGRTAEQVVRAALAQFPGMAMALRRVPRVRTVRAAREAVRAAGRAGGILVHTLVSGDLRDAVADEARRQDVATIDLLGPLLLRLGDLLRVAPLARPGLLEHAEEDYRQRFEAMGFAVTHDDGQDPRGLRRADIVLVGPSRTSKTPLCIYLAWKGWRAGNVPVVGGLPLPPDLFEIDPRRVVGLTMRAERLVELRQARAALLKGAVGTGYTDPKAVRAELEGARRLYAERAWAVVDMTDKSVEEAATEVLGVLGHRPGAADVPSVRGGERPSSGVPAARRGTG